MDKSFLQFLVKDGISTNIGPNTKGKVQIKRK